MKRFILLGISVFFLGRFVQAQSPNWAEDVSCVLYSHCTGCHNPTGIAPFSLLDYSTAYSLRYAIQAAVTSGYMPPWPPDPTYNPLAHERLLTADEIATIDEWVSVSNGAQGDLTLAPPPPVYTTSEVFTSPEWVAEVEPYTSQAFSQDDYRCFVVTNTTGADKMITGFEVVPGNVSIVHHVLVYSDDTNTPINRDNAEAGPGYTCFGGTRSAASVFIGGWAPGSEPITYPSGMGFLLAADANLVVQIHYPHGSAGSEDIGTKINFELSDDLNLREVTTDYTLNHFTTLTNGPLFIPANTIRTFNASYTIPIPVTVLSLFPHMHLIGESIKTWAETPTGQVINLIDIPRWDFEWQGTYSFRQPVVLPPGTVVHAEAVYNNTSSNPYNPSNPPQDVSSGEATTDEMMIVFFSYTPYQAGDENIVIDDGAHPVEYCDTVNFNPILPLELTYFKVEQSTRTHVLEWETAFELNIAQFEIERSTEGSNFEYLGTVNAEGVPLGAYQYSFVDAYPRQGTNYYRLKIVEDNGLFEYSEVVNATYGSDFPLIVYPNPVKGVLNFETEANLVEQVELLDVSGRLVVEKNYLNAVSKSSLEVSDLPRGVYLLKVRYKDSLITYVQKVLLE